MSSIGPKRTWASALHMSAFGGEADITFCGNLRSRSLLGVKRTSAFAPHMSAFDPKRTWRLHCKKSSQSGHALHLRHDRPSNDVGLQSNSLMQPRRGIKGRYVT